MELSPLLVVHLDGGIDGEPYVEAAVGVEMSEFAAPGNYVRSGEVETVRECDTAGAGEGAIGRKVLNSG